MTEIRRIAPADAELLRSVRLRALRDSPDAFGTTLAEAAARPMSWWEDAAAQRSQGWTECTFFAESGGEVVGLVGGYWSDRPNAVVELISMWVAPEARRSGIASQLLNIVLGWAGMAAAASVQLWVTANNQPAIHLYEHLGFQMTPDRQPLPSNPALDEVRMVLGWDQT
jgi:ribosomal protein S18 acetylase RimI-like enzyme